MRSGVDAGICLGVKCDGSKKKKRFAGLGAACADRDDDTPKAIRGGSWVNTKTILRAAVRDKFVAGDRNEIVGFRLARDL